MGRPKIGKSIAFCFRSLTRRKYELRSFCVQSRRRSPLSEKFCERCWVVKLLLAEAFVFAGSRPMMRSAIGEIFGEPRIDAPAAVVTPVYGSATVVANIPLR